MSTKASKNSSSSSTPSTSTEDSFIPLMPTLNENSIITLLPCEYDPINGYGSPSESEDSLDSSEIVDSSDDELEVVKINEIYKTNEILI